MIPPNYGKLFIKLLQTNTNFELVNDKQKKTTDGPEIANIFNKFFSTVNPQWPLKLPPPKQ